MARQKRPKLVMIPIRFPEDLEEWMRERASQTEGSIADVARNAVRAYRDQVDPQLPLPFDRRAG